MDNVETIRKVLIKYCEPKMDGMTAYEIATIILRELNIKENDNERQN